MARTARLSRRFYETFGDENTNEPVGLLNEMDATYLGELRQLNAQNFALFDAKLDQRVAELRGEFRAVAAELRGEFRAEGAELRGEMQAGLERIGKEVAHANVISLRWFVGLAIGALISIGLGVLGVLR